MLRKNHVARIMAVMLMISVMVSMAGVEGAFEIKINTVQHSTPINGEIPAGTTTPVSTTPVTPIPTLTVPVTSIPAATPTQPVTVQTTVNPPGNGNTITDQGPDQEDFWAFINSLFDSSIGQPGPEIIPVTTMPTPVPTTLPTTVATTVPTPVPTTLPTTIATTVPMPVTTTLPTKITTTVPTPVQTTLPTTIATTVPTPAPVSNNEVRGNGTICFVTTDGGFFGIVSDEGTRYIPGKIDPLFQEEGLRVTYRLVERPDRTNPHKWGVPVDLLELVQVGRVIEQRIDGNGIIHYEDIEGGFYGISTDNGGRYLPINLDDPFKTDGLKVNFSAYPATVSTISMWGTPVRLVSISGIDEPGQPSIVMRGHIGWLGSSQDSGTYAIYGDDGTIYVPSELDGAFKRNGLYVQFTAERVRTQYDVPRQGVMVRLLSIEIYNR